jgi:hypothetical protein
MNITFTINSFRGVIEDHPQWDFTPILRGWE